MAVRHPKNLLILTLDKHQISDRFVELVSQVEELGHDLLDIQIHNGTTRNASDTQIS